MLLDCLKAACHGYSCSDLKPCEARGPSAAGVTQAVSLALTDNPGYGYCNVYPSIMFLYCISMVIYIYICIYIIYRSHIDVYRYINIYIYVYLWLWLMYIFLYLD